jgi:ADP-ribose pyrophosphatase YjhB (NUDIX family)
MIKCTFENNVNAQLRHGCADVLVIKENKILLVKRIPELFEGGKWGLVGGYVERDETIKQTVSREILEETGYVVKNIQLLTIRDNPNRRHEDRQNIAFVYFCDAGEKIGQPDGESTEQVWFSFDALPKEEEIAFDHYEDIELYLKYKKENFNIPFLIN